MLGECLHTNLSGESKLLELSLHSALRTLLAYGIECSVSLEELVAYFTGPTYVGDTIGLSDVLSNELLLLHEVAEICILKKMSYSITQDTILKAYPNTYYAHLVAMNIELSEAERRGKRDWVEKRCRDLESYLEDPYLPSNLEAFVHELISKYCRRSS